MQYINWYGVLLASILSVILAHFWYSPILFGKNLNQEKNDTNFVTASNVHPKLYLISFLMSFVFAFMLAKTIIRTDYSGMADGLKFGFMVGICFSAMSIGINYQFNKKPAELFFIDAGYVVASSTIMGAIIGWMNA